MTEAEMLAEVAEENPVEEEVQETTEEEAVVEEAPLPGENPEPETAEEESTEENPYKFDLRVNGEDIEREYTKDEIKALVQKGLASGQQFEDASKLKAQSQKLIDNLKDPNKARSVLRNFLGEEGLNELAQTELYDKYKLSEMDEETRAIHEENMELRRIREEKEEKLSTYERQIEEQEVNRDTQVLLNNIEASLEKYNLPKNENNMDLVVNELQLALARDEVMTEEEAVKITADKLQLGMMDFAKNAEIENLIGLLGNDAVKKINKYVIDQQRTVKQPPQGTNYSRKPNTADKLEAELIQANNFEDVMLDIARSAGI
jgi:hypothetical protein